MASITIALSANTLYYPEGGGHLWAYLNWALGFRAAGCRVVWMEEYNATEPTAVTAALVAGLKRRLEPYGLSGSLALWSERGDSRTLPPVPGCLHIEEVLAGADLLVNQYYDMPAGLLHSFRRTALLDIDPGLTQIWISRGAMKMAPHDLYFTIGETVGRADARFPDLGVRWIHTPPGVALDAWPVVKAAEGAPLTTVTHWYMNEWEEDNGELYSNSKRDGFLPFLEIPRLSPFPLELAALLRGDEAERGMLERLGWQVRESHTVTSTPGDYQRYIQGSLGEFSCAKPSCVRLQNAWISDRTICYLASGKPAVVQFTGPSRFLPDAEGLLRFRDLHEAVRRLEMLEADYEHHAAGARALAEDHFDARKVATRFLERALP